MARARPPSVMAQAQRGSAPPWRAAAWGAVVGVMMAFVAFAPARWLAAAVGSATQGRVIVSEASGTVWEGSGALTLTGGPGSREAWTLPGRLGWALSWGGLRPRVTLHQPCCLSAPLVWRLEVVPGAFGVVLEALPEAVRVAGGPGAPGAGGGQLAGDFPPIGHWPARWLTALGTPWNTIQPAGLVRVSSPGLRIGLAQGRVQMEGSLRADFVGMSSRLSTLAVLGSYRADLAGTSAQGGVPTLSVTTLDGPLLLSGQGQWVGDRWRLRGEARAAAGSESALQNLLNLIGRRDGDRAILSIG